MTLESLAKFHFVQVKAGFKYEIIYLELKYNLLYLFQGILSLKQSLNKVFHL